MEGLKLLTADLQLFAEGAGTGAGAAPGGAAPAGGEGGLPVASQQAGTAGETAQDKKPIVYDSPRKRRREARLQRQAGHGQQPAGNAGAGTDGAQGHENAVRGAEGDDPTEAGAVAERGAGAKDDPAETVPKDKRTLFREMVSEGGEYKAEFDEFFRERFNARYKEIMKKRGDGAEGSSGAAENRAQEYDSFFDRLGAVYGTRTREDTVKALMDDTAFWEAKADESGMSRAQLENSLKAAEETARIKRENAMLREAQDKRNTAERTEKLATAREAEITALRKEFPDFDLEAEAKNPQFVAMLRMEALPLRTIYAAIHHDEIVSGSVKTAKAETEAAVVANIRARGQRPAENGASGLGGVSVSTGVASLTRAERAAIARRAAAGEQITFRK